MKTYADRIAALEQKVRDFGKVFPIHFKISPTITPVPMAFSTHLTHAQAERLSILAEECAEVIKCVTKIQRHGFESINPDAPEDGTNRQQLEREIADAQAIIQLMMSSRDVDAESIGKLVTPAINRKLAFCHFQ